METNENLLPTSSCELLARTLLGASRRVGMDTICPRGMGPTMAQTRELNRGSADLRTSLKRDPMDGAVVTAILARLLTSYPMREGESQTAEVRLQTYQTATAGFPAWVVSSAAERWSQAESGLPNANSAFAPSPAQLAEICKIVAGVVWHRIGLLDRAASIVEEAPPPDDAQRAAYIDGMVAKHGPGFGLAAADEEAKERRAALNAQTLKASAVMRKRDFEAAGLLEEHELQPSPALLRSIADRYEAA